MEIEDIIILLDCAIVHNFDVYYNELVARFRLGKLIGCQRLDGHKGCCNIVHGDGLPDCTDLRATWSIA